VNRRVVATCVAVAGLLGGACAVRGQDHADVQPDDAVPFGLLEADAPQLLPPATSTATETAALCFVEGNQLAIVGVALDPPFELDGVVAALAEPPAAERSLRTAVGEPPPVRNVRLVAGVAHVDLLPSISALGGDEQLLAIAQIVCTLTGRPGVGLVAFSLDGSQIDVPRGDGSLTNGPVSRDDYIELLG